MNYKDLREWIELVDKMGELKRINGADWNLEIGAIGQLSESKRGENQGPALLFDNIPGFPPGYRVLTNYFTSANRFALTTNLPIGLPIHGYVNAWLEKYSTLPRIQPKYVTTGPVMENVQEGENIDLLKFPTPKWYELDGGRYIGTGNMNITIDPDEGWVNLGTYRVMLLDKSRVIIYMSPGRHGLIHREKWFSKGLPFPVAISVGQDPLLFVLSGSEQPYGVCEYEIAGGIKGEPIEVIKGPVTGLPIPAQAEIVLEGECIPGDVAMEGPFGEWTGYYASGARPEPVVNVKAVYHRNDPIITGSPGVRAPKGVTLQYQIMKSAILKRQMEMAGIPNVTGVWMHREGGGGFLLTAVSIKQVYPGHARQAGQLASSCHAGAYCGRFVIVVDDDIDVTDLSQVIWAMCTRCDPEKDIELLRRCWSTPLDPIIPVENKGLNSRVIIDACRPYEWRDKFPPVVDISKRLEDETMKKWSKVILG